jgi:5-(carboxyamino)imidazole ribonucleotide synthase
MDPQTGLPVVGVVGAGQLARMMHQAAIGLGQSLRILAETPASSAGLVAAEVRHGPADDLAVLRDFAKGCQVVTFDHEQVPAEHLAVLAAEGVPLYPSPQALVFAQDKQAMRARLGAEGYPVPRWASVGSHDEALAFLAEVPQAGVVLKAARGGYDGRGVWFLDDADHLAETVDQLLAQGVPLIAEERVPLTRELAAVVARSPFGQVAAWPVVETVQQDGMCREVLAPAPGLADDRALAAQELAIRIARDLEVVGVLAVELFETPEALVVNELAMRPHNSAHWTIDGSRTSQFEQHLRAILDYPLGETAPLAPAVAMANVVGGSEPGSLDERLHHLFAADPGVKVHLYGKEPRPGRKLGHVTVLGEEIQAVRERARAAAETLQGGV